MKEKQTEHLCGNCRHFVSDRDGKPYNKTAGYCRQLVNTVTEFDKNGTPNVKSIKAPHIFSHFHCSNNKFQNR